MQNCKHGSFDDFVNKILVLYIFIIKKKNIE